MPLVTIYFILKLISKQFRKRKFNKIQAFHDAFVMVSLIEIWLLTGSFPMKRSEECTYQKQ